VVVDVLCEEMLMEKSEELLDEIFETALNYDMTYFG
jgi:hypothetical protein